MNVTLQLIFWFSIVGLGYIFAGYPILVWFRARRWPRPVLKRNVPRTLSIVIVAHNEAKTLPRKIASLLSCKKAEWIEEIVIGSDGSTDDTVAILKGHSNSRVKVVEFGERRGKPAALNDLVPQCHGEFIVFADARQDFDVDCLERLLENFADPTVGVVSGELILRSALDETTAAEGIGFYWKYEKFIRKFESQYWSVPGATGACYALRKSLFQPIPDQTILDDVAIPMQAVAKGYRCIFEPGALIYDTPSQSTKKESVRKRRTIAGAAQLIRLFPGWIWPGSNPLWFEYISHKLLRLVSPLLLVAAFATNVVLIANPVYFLILVAQLAFYASAATGWYYQTQGRKVRYFGPSLMFLTLNLTTLLALWDAARSRYRVTWQK